MALLGPRSLIDLAIPTGVDASEIMRFEMREGQTAEGVITMAATVIGEANEMAESQYGGLWTRTTRQWVRYRIGDGERTMTPLASEFSDPDGVRSDRIGHMLRLLKYKDAVEWSVEYLQEAIRDDLRDDVLTIKERWVNRIDYEIVERMLTTTEHLQGSAGYAPPWAIGTGMNLNYIPPQWMAYVFDSTHTHFIRVNGAISKTNIASTLQTMAQELSHHGHTGPKVAFFSEANLATVNEMVDDVKFAKFLPANFRNTGVAGTPVSTIPATLEGVPGEIIGYYASDYGLVELRYHPRFPAGYLWMGKSYGINSPNNPLAIREDPLVGGFGLTIDPQVSRSIVPKLDKIVFNARHGVNVNDRLNGVAAQIASGGATYENPTIT